MEGLDHHSVKQCSWILLSWEAADSKSYRLMRLILDIICFILVIIL